MRCELTPEGVLIVCSENDIEEYGLKRWREENEYGKSFDEFIGLKKK